MTIGVTCVPNESVELEERGDMRNLIAITMITADGRNY